MSHYIFSEGEMKTKYIPVSYISISPSSFCHHMSYQLCPTRWQENKGKLLRYVSSYIFLRRDEKKIFTCELHLYKSWQLLPSYERPAPGQPGGRRKQGNLVYLLQLLDTFPGSLQCPQHSQQRHNTEKILHFITLILNFYIYFIYIQFSLVLNYQQINYYVIVQRMLLYQVTCP